MNAYLQMLPQLEARAQLQAIEASSVPHMTTEGRRSVLRSHQDNLGETVKPVAASAADLAGMGIQVEHVPKAVSDGE